MKVNQNKQNQNKKNMSRPFSVFPFTDCALKCRRKIRLTLYKLLQMRETAGPRHGGFADSTLERYSGVTSYVAHFIFCK